jgi:hypothetical protein
MSVPILVILYWEVGIIQRNWKLGELGKVLVNRFASSQECNSRD